ncbi:hypothetical protein H8959_018316 [Pygathrix nigripes]
MHAFQPCRPEPIHFPGGLWDSALFFPGFAITNCLLLAVMGYDRYVAICNPLGYSVIMNWKVCAILASSVCATGFSLSLVQTVAIFRLPFGSPLIEHFFCDIWPVLDLACATPVTSDILTLIINLLSITAPVTFLFNSYVLIISTILKIASAGGRKKTFPTCASHLTVVIIHYGCASIAYFKLKLENTKDQDQLISVTHTVITPLLNSVVYSLRNKEVQDALQRVLDKPHGGEDLVGLTEMSFLMNKLCHSNVFLLTLAINNCFLLTAMGYDRYVAICNPLRYSVVMSKRVSAPLLVVIRPVMKLSCIDTTVDEILTMTISVLVILIPKGLVFISYILIISTILKIASAEGRKKDFATCASHITVVIVHYSCASIAYFKPNSENTRDQDQLLSVTYTVITPLLNPVVYTLRNKEVKDALCRAISQKLS